MVNRAKQRRSDRESPAPGRPKTPDTGCAPAGAREAFECSSAMLPARPRVAFSRPFRARFVFRRRCPVVSPPANFSRARVSNSRLPFFARSEMILHGFDASLVALPSCVQHEEPGTWVSPTHRQRVHSSIGGILRNMDGVAHAVGATGDHIHIAAGLRATHCLADVMREVKSESTRCIHAELAAFRLCVSKRLSRLYLR